MRSRESIKKDMDEFIKANPMPKEVAFYHKLITEIFLDIRAILACGTFQINNKHLKQIIKFEDLGGDDERIKDR